MKIYQFKAKNSVVKPYSLCFRNILKVFTTNNVKQLGLRDMCTFFFVDYNTNDSSNIVDIHKYLIKKHSIV